MPLWCALLCVVLTRCYRFPQVEEVNRRYILSQVSVVEGEGGRERGRERERENGWRWEQLYTVPHTLCVPVTCMICMYQLEYDLVHVHVHVHVDPMLSF